jgi:urea transporter
VTDSDPSSSPALETPASTRPRKGPLSFLSGSLTAGLLAWLALGLSQRLVAYYALHPPSYGSAIAQSIATALKTLIVGMSFLATFSFAFIALGLGLVFVQSLVSGSGSAPAEADKTA